MRLQRCDVRSRHHFGGAFDGTQGIAFRGLDRQHFARRRRLFVGFDHAVRRQIGTIAIVPLDFQCTTGFDRAPVSVGNYGHTIRDLHHINHARHGFGSCAVNALDLATDDRTLLQAGVNHAWQFHVDTELGSTVHLGRHVETRNTLADNAEVFGCFDAWLFWHGLLGSRFSHLAVSGFFAARAGQHAVCSFHSAGRNAPLCGGTSDQHFAHLRASDTQFFPAFTNGGGTAGDHGAEESVSVNSAGRSGSDSDLGHVDIQLFCDQHRHGGVNTLAHF